MNFKNVLLVCHANICRSPLAEALFKAETGDASERVFQSAGVAAVDGQAVDGMISALLRERGLDASGHRSRRLTQHIIRGADLVLVMETRQIKSVESIDPASRGKVHLLGKWINAEIADPYRCNEPVYRDSFALVDRCITTWTKKLC